MDLQQRVNLLEKLGNYILTDNDSWQAAKKEAHLENNWFIPEFVDNAAAHMARSLLTKEALERWMANYSIPSQHPAPKNIGIVMAGNIPMVGFHDLVTAFLSGHRQTIKMSSKDQVLIRHLVEQLYQYDETAREYIGFADMLKGCDAYIATGSNNSSRYFEYYFGKYPHIIRRNRSSVAILTGKENAAELSRLADDVYLYFGLGCRNVTKIYVPHNYDFISLLEAFKKYDYLIDHNKYKNNYDYQLAVLIINKHFYMTNGSLILHEEKSIFSPISQLNYEFYDNEAALAGELQQNQDVQCLVGKKYITFGKAQYPAAGDYADGADTLKFLLEI